MISSEEETIRYAEIMVREAGYNYMITDQLRGAILRKGQSKFDTEDVVSRSAALYECSKSVLRSIDPDNAEAFIQSTYGADINV